MSHPFQVGVGDRDESPKEGWGGDRDESSKRGVSQGRRHQSQPREGGGGADYVNLALQNTVSPQTVSISKRWVQSPYLTTCTPPFGFAEQNIEVQVTGYRRAGVDSCNIALLSF